MPGAIQDECLPKRAQECFAAFGDNGFGTVGTETTINSGDMAGVLMIAIQALENALRT